MLKFIGGTNYISVSNYIKKIYHCSIIPIIDYAKEYSKKEYDVIKYDKELTSVISQINKQHINKDIAYACKLSSYLPYNKEEYINKFVKKIINTSHRDKYIFFDSEYTNIRQQEDYVFDKIIEKYQDIDNLHIFKTYQMYKKNGLNEIENDIKKFDKIGIKLVRGAYHSYNDNELFKIKQHTDDNYNNAINYLINNTNNKICLATHNKISVDYSLSLNPKENVMYAQLLGMGNNLTKYLIDNNKKVFKYIPYGNIFDIYPYLLRRLYENIDMIKHI